MSPMLFNLLMADLEEEMGRGERLGGVRLMGEKIFSLAYADDIVLIAEEERGMKWLIGKAEEYMEKKGLEVNVEKTKIMRFRRGGGRKKKVEWKWKGRRIEEVGEFKYLGIIFKRNGGLEAHVKERAKRAMVVWRQVWGIGKRRFGRDWERRLWLFDRLVWAVMGYGAEVWGWRERKEMKAVQERAIRWILGVEWRTPGYIVREEVGRGKLRIRAARRAWDFEEKLAKGKGSEIARKCLEEIRKREGRERELTGWEKEKKECRGPGGEVMEQREGITGGVERWVEREKEKDKEERWRRIGEARYNRWYKEIKGEGTAKYLRKGWGESRWQRVARYWEEEEKRKCRLCEREEESWEHVWEGCGGAEERNIGWQQVVRRMLGEEGEGEGWMREVEKKRGYGGGQEE